MFVPGIYFLCKEPISTQFFKPNLNTNILAFCVVDILFKKINETFVVIAALENISLHLV